MKPEARAAYKEMPPDYGAPRAGPAPRREQRVSSPAAHSRTTVFFTRDASGWSPAWTGRLYRRSVSVAERFWLAELGTRIAYRLT